jgi:hypothetical protein
MPPRAMWAAAGSYGLEREPVVAAADDDAYVANELPDAGAAGQSYVAEGVVT